ncbi:butyrophilin subfamily 1 member A1-like [Trachemys scripta elegans]|uniref:butyrophilin subfamily 1 member A1-like n=1 Tax=Trachemys scripta elegans TaxID=31138 RepID=UPI001553DFCD|nr:butyrophilin subfamily 1 member A1-like [Trachemys scripta elegans]
MEVRWFRSQLSPFVHRYSNGKDQYGQQMPEYQQRTELLKDGLTSGSVALRIFNIRPSDEGQYSCFVQDGIDYEEALLELNVAASGSAPHISVEDYQEGGIRLVCRSSGWYPEPEVLWRDPSGQHLPSLSGTNSQEVNELFEIENSIIITENSHQNLSCVVRNTHTNHQKESTLFYISDAFFPMTNPWMVALWVILVGLAGFIGLTIYLFKIKGKHSDSLSLSLSPANVTLDPDTAHPQLVQSEDRKSVRRRDTWQDLPNNPERFEYERCVLGCEGFTSGRHYWEVEMGGGEYWAVGVARESVKRKGEIIFETQEGIWAVGHWGSQYLAVTSPRSPLVLKWVPRRIRVFLNYEVGQVAFFDADRGVLIFAFPPASFAGERILPWFWVWDTESQLRLCP